MIWNIINSCFKVPLDGGEVTQTNHGKIESGYTKSQQCVNSDSWKICYHSDEHQRRDISDH